MMLFTYNVVLRHFKLILSLNLVPKFMNYNCVANLAGLYGKHYDGTRLQHAHNKGNELSLS